MKNYLLILFMVVGIVGCDLDKTEKGELPEVDVEVDTEAGELPEYDVDWADIDVGTKTKMVEVPKVVVVMEEEEVEVPSISVDMPDEENEERTVMVEAEVSGVEHDLQIMEVRAAQRNLYVISKLEATDRELDERNYRVQDQLELNAPDLNVKHIIVGKKPDRVFNDRYKYVSSMDAMDEKIKNAEVIYSR